MDPQDPTKSYTWANQGMAPGKCVDGSDCVMVEGMTAYPPQGGKGCFPTVQTPISLLPSI